MPVTINGSNTPTAGGITYGDGTTYAVTAAGTSGRPIVSGGSGAPTFRPYTLPASDGSANQILQTDGAGALSFATPGGGFSAMDVLESGTTWTVPAGKTLIKIYVTGGGGGGSTFGIPRGAGGGGGTAIKYLTVTAGSTATIAIGGGGGSGNTGGTGGDTTFTYGGVTYTGNGGIGGSNSTNGGAGGAGGSSSGTGALLLTGQGGSNYGSISGTLVQGAAGSSFWGGGANGNTSSSGGAYGGGGPASGSGYQGVIVIEY